MVHNILRILSLWVQGMQWLSGRVLVSRSRSYRFEPHRHRCIVSLSKTHLSLLSTGSSQKTSPNIAEIVYCEMKNQVKQSMISK